VAVEPAVSACLSHSKVAFPRAALLFAGGRLHPFAACCCCFTFGRPPGRSLLWLLAFCCSLTSSSSSLYPRPDPSLSTSASLLLLSCNAIPTSRPSLLIAIVVIPFLSVVFLRARRCSHYLCPAVATPVSYTINHPPLHVSSHKRSSKAFSFRRLLTRACADSVACRYSGRSSFAAPETFSLFSASA